MADRRFLPADEKCPELPQSARIHRGHSDALRHCRRRRRRPSTSTTRRTAPTRPRRRRDAARDRKPSSPRLTPPATTLHLRPNRPPTTRPSKEWFPTSPPERLQRRQRKHRWNSGDSGGGVRERLPATVVKPAAPEIGPPKVAHSFAESFVGYEVGEKKATPGAAEDRDDPEARPRTEAGTRRACRPTARCRRPTVMNVVAGKKGRKPHGGERLADALRRDQRTAGSPWSAATDSGSSARSGVSHGPLPHSPGDDLGRARCWPPVTPRWPTAARR